MGRGLPVAKNWDGYSIGSQPSNVIRPTSFVVSEIWADETGYKPVGFYKAVEGAADPVYFPLTKTSRAPLRIEALYYSKANAADVVHTILLDAGNPPVNDAGSETDYIHVYGHGVDILSNAAGEVRVGGIEVSFNSAALLGSSATRWLLMQTEVNQTANAEVMVRWLDARTLDVVESATLELPLQWLGAEIKTAGFQAELGTEVQVAQIWVGSNTMGFPNGKKLPDTRGA